MLFPAEAGESLVEQCGLSYGFGEAEEQQGVSPAGWGVGGVAD